MKRWAGLRHGRVTAALVPCPLLSPAVREAKGSGALAGRTDRAVYSCYERKPLKSRASREMAEGAQDGGHETLSLYRRGNRAQAEATGSEEAEQIFCLLTVRGSRGSEKEALGREEGFGGCQVQRRL